MSTEAPKSEPPAGAEPKEPGTGDFRNPRRLGWAFAVAAGAFLLLESVDGFIAVPLREISSVLVEFVLGLVGFPISRAGTILATPRVTFDIVPACSGSTTLRVLLFVTIVWCGIHPRLPFARRALCVALAVPLALLANAARVSALVFIGHLGGSAPGEVLHVFSGIVAFILAMGACFLLTDRLAVSPDALASDSGRRVSVFLAVLLIFLSAPFLFWCVQAWSGSALDRFGYLFVILAVGWGAWRWYRTPGDASWEKSGTAGLGLMLLLLLVAVLVDVNILKGIACLGALFAVTVAYKGLRFAVSAAPLFLMAYLGFPTVSYQLQAATLPLLGSASLEKSMAVKATLALLLALSTTLPPLRHRPAAEAAGVPRFRYVCLLMAALLAAFQGYYYSTSGGEASAVRLNMSFLQGSWVGRNHEIPGSQEDFFAGRIWSRRYTRGEAAVDVLVTSTGGDRHRAHPPEYCLTGGGWEVTESRTEPTGAEPRTRMRLARDGREMSFCYWFTDGREGYATYKDMLVQDTLRRLTGRRTDWFLFRVMTEQGDLRLEEFLAEFRPALAPQSVE